MPRGNIDNLIPNSKRSPEELREMTRKGGIASGEARRAKRDMRERMKMMLEEKPKGKDYTYADRLTESMLTIAANPKNGAAAVRAYETILHIIGQDEPEARQDALDTLRQILEVNIKNARLQTEQETE
jgi:hypothetical protein